VDGRFALVAGCTYATLVDVPSRSAGKTIDPPQARGCGIAAAITPNGKLAQIGDEGAVSTIDIDKVFAASGDFVYARRTLIPEVGCSVLEMLNDQVSLIGGYSNKPVFWRNPGPKPHWAYIWFTDLTQPELQQDPHPVEFGPVAPTSLCINVNRKLAVATGDASSLVIDIATKTVARSLGGARSSAFLGSSLVLLGTGGQVTAVNAVTTHVMASLNLPAGQQIAACCKPPCCAIVGDGVLHII
jgi:hypothetical protein